MTERPFHWRRLAPAIALAALVIAAAPFLGTARDLALGLLPRRAFDLAIAGLALLVASALLVGVSRLEQRRRLRVAGLVVCALLVWLQIAGFATGIPEVDAVERAHIVEYGLLAALFFRAFLPHGALPALALATVAGSFVGILDEWLQWLVATRVGEMGDVWLNAAAAGTGALAGLCVAPAAKLGLPFTPGARSATGWLVAATVLAFGAFFECAHRGYEIHDRQAGIVFRSWHSAEELREISAQRARRWREGHLPVLEPTRREDHYFIEGTSRVMHRNVSLEQSLYAAAWLEQRILERWYRPVLEQRGLRSGQPLNLGRAQRAQLAGLAGPPASSRPYRSPVLADRIVVGVSATTWWAGVACAAAVAAGLGAWPSWRPSGPFPGGS